jgi:hypothetical protein
MTETGAHAHKQLNWTTAPPEVVELVFASFLANDLAEAIMAKDKTKKMDTILTLLQADPRFSDHGVKPPSISTLSSWLANGRKAWNGYTTARVSRYARSTTRAPCVSPLMRVTAAAPSTAPERRRRRSRAGRARGGQPHRGPGGH